MDFSFPYCEFIFKSRLWWTANTYGSSFNSYLFKGDVKVLRGKGSLELSRTVWKGHTNILLETTKQQSSKTPGVPSAPLTLQHTNSALGLTNTGAVLKLPVKDYKCWLQFLDKDNKISQLWPQLSVSCLSSCYYGGSLCIKLPQPKPSSDTYQIILWFTIILWLW